MALCPFLFTDKVTEPREPTPICRRMRTGCFHGLRGGASTVLTATGQVNGRWRILTPHRIETHESTATKFRTIDYVRERTP